LRLASQPALAGIKHLNRLEQVLARAEWDDPAIDEGLLCDASGHVVCATAANLFAVIDGRLVTPDVSHAGVAGVARAIVVDALAAEVRRVSADDIERASEVFLTNALRGVMRVARIDARRFGSGPLAAEAARALARAGLPQAGLR
jgi:4-amino-4-deoxychorismate lyase